MEDSNELAKFRREWVGELKDAPKPEPVGEVSVHAVCAGSSMRSADTAKSGECLQSSPKSYFATVSSEQASNDHSTESDNVNLAPRKPPIHSVCVGNVKFQHSDSHPSTAGPKPKAKTKKNFIKQNQQNKPTLSPFIIADKLLHGHPAKESVQPSCPAPDEEIREEFIKNRNKRLKLSSQSSSCDQKSTDSFLDLFLADLVNVCCIYRDRLVPSPNCYAQPQGLVALNVSCNSICYYHLYLHHLQVHRQYI